MADKAKGACGGTRMRGHAATGHLVTWSTPPRSYLCTFHTTTHIHLYSTINLLKYGKNLDFRETSSSCEAHQHNISYIMQRLLQITVRESMSKIPKNMSGEIREAKDKF